MADGKTASLITPPGFGGIAVIRLTGRSVLELISSIFTSVSGVKSDSFKPDKYYLGHISDSDEIIDQVMLIIRADGNEAELHSHGGPRVIQRILILLSDLAVDIVDYHLQYDLDSLKKEVDFYLCQLHTELALSAISWQYPNGLNEWLNENIMKLQKGSCSSFVNDAHDLLATFHIGHRLLHPSKVVLAGPPNAGKSTLANYLTGRQQSLVSQLPGTTRDWTSEFTDIEGLAVELIDTAGLRDSSDQLENCGIEKGLEIYKQADLIVLLLPADNEYDSRHLADIYTDAFPATAKVITVVSKADIAPDKSRYNDISYLSVHSQQGITELKKEIRRQLGIEDNYKFQSPLVFTARQHQLIKASTLTSSSEAINLLKQCIGL